MSAKKRIITCAISGASHTPAMSPHLPLSIEEMVQHSVAAAEAGASVIHLHARDPENGRPTADPGLFREYVTQIKAQCDAVVSLTTGGATGQTIQERLNVVRVLQPELCTCNLGTMNYGLYPMIPKYQESWRYAWEAPYLESTRTEPFVSSFGDIEYMLKILSAETGTRFEFEAYDIGHLYTLAHFLDSGLVQPPIFIQFVIGTMGGIGPDVDNVVFMKRTADRLLGEDLEWSVLGSGRHQMNLITVGAIMGSHVRVGLEDSLYLQKGRLAQSNAEQVSKIGRILTELSIQTATPTETRHMLGLKGLDNVGF